MAAVIAWRTPGAVDAIERHQWLVALQAVSLAAVGVALWRELVGSGPIAPLRPFRAVLAAVAMWTVWVVAYVAGFSATSWYVAFHHFAGRGLSAAADQQFATGVLWLAASLSFMPVVFWNVLAWLRSEDSREVGLGGAVATRGPLS
jgi:cytochrome c oxidase assembly factor CtaG